MPISKSLRFEVLRRDGFACKYCGAKAPDVQLHIDHVIPEAHGGPATAENLNTSCMDCNFGKGSTPPDAELVSQVAEDAARWAAAIKQAGEEMRARDTSAQWFIDLWNQVVIDVEFLPLNATQSIIWFTEQGLPRETIEEMFWVAVGARHVSDRHRFAYFAGCCHKRVARLQERASEIATEVGDGEEG